MVVKGIIGGDCNRTSCQAPGAFWFNHSTRAYYCEACAGILNHANSDYLTPDGELLCVSRLSVDETKRIVPFDHITHVRLWRERYSDLRWGQFVWNHFKNPLFKGSWPELFYETSGTVSSRLIFEEIHE